MNLLFSIDDMYVDHFKVMLYSLVRQTKNRKLEIYVLQKTLLKRHTELIQYTQNLEVGYHPIIVGTEVFAQAPTTDRYPDKIYYRLLAHKFLPETLDRILYLDADMLCLNDFSSLYDMELGDQLYAAASHNTDGKFLDYVNKLRLKNVELESSYFNTGVLLMNLPAIRKVVHQQTILDYIMQNRGRLILPDQDILNGLYANLVKSIPDEIYNYDARYSLIYQLKSRNEWDLEWVINHTVFLHFAGRDKPWKKDYRGRYSGLYKFMAKEALTKN
ncbi:glycosyltransferase family 8 protein [Streptococcus agalactiae]|uniref:glycosyltransferase family 8 protein n=1 Tax=Streptococcus agalactiae TaxID=1311 RepID=UPI00085C7DBD|nr:glycosyltransferase family 8 protein [Streptococcus agalactiae]